MARIRYFLTETLLWAAAVLGLIAVVLVALAYFFNISIILFRTGSMEPTISSGSAALVREIPADEVSVGDILTVERAGEMPVTHRVTSLDVGDRPGERVITMQGDANESPDPAPYTITEGRVVLGSVPGLANAIHHMGHPYVMGSITLGASVLVGWAFWPKGGGRSGPKSVRRQSKRFEPEYDRPRHAGTVLGIVVVATTAVTLLNAEPATASSAHQGNTGVVEDTIASRFITLTSIYDPSTRQNLAPWDISEWDVGLEVEGPTGGEVRTGLSARGDLPLEVTVSACSSRWETDPSDNGPPPDTSCADSSRVVAEDLLILPNDDVNWIDEFSTDETPWLRIAVTLPGSAPPASKAELRVHAEAWGEEVSTTPKADPNDAADSGLGEDAPAKDTWEQPGDEMAPGADEQSPRGDDLARTGFALWALLVAAVLSILLGRWLQARARSHAASQDLRET